MPEALLLHRRSELRAEAAVACRFVNDDAATRLADRRAERVGIERREGAYIDDLRIDLCQSHGRFRHMHHRAVSEQGHVLPGTDNLGFRQGNLVIALRHRTLGVRAPGDGRLVWIAVEWAVVEPLRLEEHDRVLVLDGADEESL